MAGKSFRAQFGLLTPIKDKPIAFGTIESTNKFGNDASIAIAVNEAAYYNCDEKYIEQDN